MPSFYTLSKQRLDTCHPDLIRLFEEVVKHYDCTILEGHRTMERQKELFRSGASKTLASKHLTSPSVAVDVVPYPIDWEDKERQLEFATYVYDIAMKMGIRVRWGGRFRNFYDSPHWELL